MLKRSNPRPLGHSQWLQSLTENFNLGVICLPAHCQDIQELFLDRMVFRPQLATVFTRIDVLPARSSSPERLPTSSGSARMEQHPPGHDRQPCDVHGCVLIQSLRAWKIAVLRSWRQYPYLISLNIKANATLKSALVFVNFEYASLVDFAYSYIPKCFAHCFFFRLNFLDRTPVFKDNTTNKCKDSNFE